MTDDPAAPRGAPVPGWSGAAVPSARPLAGRHVRLEPLAETHLDPLHAVLMPAPDRDWAYMPFGPFADAAAFRAWAERQVGGTDPLFFAILDAADGRPGGFASFLNIKPATGSIEIGFIQIAPHLQRTTGATEALWLMMREAFALGYRRLEWKCDALNRRSRRAAARLGFGFEGVFLQHLVVKGRNRDTAWFSITDGEWTALAPVFDAWFAAVEAAGEGPPPRLSDGTAAVRRADPVDPLAAADD